MRSEARPTRREALRRLGWPEPEGNARGLALVYFGMGALWVYVATFGAVPGVDAAGGAVAGGAAVAAGATCLALAARFQSWMTHAGVCAAALAASLALTQATTAVDAVLLISSLVWSAIYVGVVFAPPVGRLYAVLFTICLGGGLAGSAVGDPVGVWVAFGATFATTIEVLGRTISRLRADAMTDPLTGLLNRKGFLDASRRVVSICRRSGEPVAVVHIDLDGFKQVNDREGHRHGDRLLQLCAEAWRRQLRVSDILARVGGDEFVLVLPGRDRRSAEAIVTRLRRESPIGWSHGAAELEPGDEDIESSVARADAEMYVVKAVSRPDAAERSLPQPTIRTGVPRGSRRAIQLT